MLPALRSPTSPNQGEACSGSRDRGLGPPEISQSGAPNPTMDESQEAGAALGDGWVTGN